MLKLIKYELRKDMTLYIVIFPYFLHLNFTLAEVFYAKVMPTLPYQ